jgi:cytochrome c
MTPLSMFLRKFSHRRLGSARMLTAALIALACTGAFLFDAPTAQSDEKSDAKAKKALAEVVAKGQTLYRKSWKKGAKGCFACHTRGPNKLTHARLKTYPKYDKSLRKVVTVQEKMNAMIKGKSGGKALDLGHKDLTALEAYISTLK